MLVSSVSYTYT